MNRSIMSTLNRLACGLALVIGTVAAHAQDSSMSSSSTNQETFFTPAAYQPLSVGAEVGTTGIGGTASWRFLNHFGVAGGADYLSISMNRTISDVNYTAKVRLQSENVGLHIYPSKTSSFYIGLGAYFNQNQLNGTAVSDGSLVVDGQLIPPGDYVKLNYKQQPVAPYVSVGGNLYFDKGHHISLGGELGAFYLGNPKVKITSNDPAFDSTSYQQQAEHDLKKIPVWPILKVSLNFSF